ncbi:MAG: hypothetical protein AAB582_03885 [Patescibacteria group bacterium]
MKRLSLKFKDFAVELWICPELMRDVGVRRIEEVEENLLTFLQQLDVEENKYLLLYLEKVQKPRMAVLMAHGTFEGPRVFDGWWYTTAGVNYSVQEWIDKREAEGYGAITLMSCNLAGQTPRSSEALLIVPDTPFSIPRVEQGEICINLIHPKKGELQHVIEHELRSLRASKKRAPH